MPLYEHVMISRQDLSNTQAEGLIEHFGTVLSDNDGKLVDSEYWGIKTMAYKINKNRKGHYAFLRSDAPAPAILEMERLMRLHDDVMRVLTIKVDEHAVVGLGHGLEGEVGRAAVAVLAAQGVGRAVGVARVIEVRAVGTLEEAGPVVAGDDDLFPSFQLGYLAASAVPLVGHRHLGAGFVAQGEQQFGLLAVTAETGLVGHHAGVDGIGTVGRVVIAAPEQEHGDRGHQQQRKCLFHVRTILVTPTPAVRLA